MPRAKTKPAPLVKDIPEGTYFETLIFGTPTGNIYKAGSMMPGGLRRVGWKCAVGSARTIEKVLLWASNKCRIIDPKTLDM